MRFELAFSSVVFLSRKCMRISYKPQWSSRLCHLPNSVLFKAIADTLHLENNDLSRFKDRKRLMKNSIKEYFLS